jgi:hypothetical protein
MKQEVLGRAHALNFRSLERKYEVVLFRACTVKADVILLSDEQELLDKE